MKRIAITHTAALSGPVAEEPLANPRARKMMSRAAYLAARCLSTLLADTAWTDRGQVGYFLGVGASGGSLADVRELLERGVAACNPLLAFQLMNNFAMCHGAILENLGGPNAALFSRGSGTIAALAEALHAIDSGDCTHAIGGGADEATHPVTVAELTRDGFIGRGLAPADGAALLALAHSDAPDAIVIEGCAHASGRDRPVREAIESALAHATRKNRVDDDARAENGSGEMGSDPFSTSARVDAVVIAPWGPPAADALRSFVAARFPSATVLDTSALGETLAGGPALAVATAFDHLARGASDSQQGWSDHHSDAPHSSRRVVVLTLGVDGDPGVVILSRGTMSAAGTDVVGESRGVA